MYIINQIHNNEKLSIEKLTVTKSILKDDSKHCWIMRENTLYPDIKSILWYKWTTKSQSNQSFLKNNKEKNPRQWTITDQTKKFDQNYKSTEISFYITKKDHTTIQLAFTYTHTYTYTWRVEHVTHIRTLLALFNAVYKALLIASFILELRARVFSVASNYSL